MIGNHIAARHPLPEGAPTQFDAFHAMLCDWNTRIDLTAIQSDEDALFRHYLDSLTALSLLPAHTSVIDVGTGAGFPGVPLSIARPDLDVTLLDALQKRVDFLQHAIDKIPLHAQAIHGRAEDYARLHREAHDVAVSRAVASLPVLLEWMLPLVRVGGQCIIWKGPGVQEEMADAQRVAPLLGGGAITVVDAPIPEQNWQHVLVCVQKETPTPEKFPRRAGMAIKRPL